MDEIQRMRSKYIKLYTQKKELEPLPSADLESFCKEYAKLEAQVEEEKHNQDNRAKARYNRRIGMGFTPSGINHSYSELDRFFRANYKKRVSLVAGVLADEEISSELLEFSDEELAKMLLLKRFTLVYAKVIAKEIRDIARLLNEPRTEEAGE